ncbi:MAG TPA: DUF3536 domain-containing protein [Dehalococcoidia bacterium]|nr:DUF3536 domain-containing protein [Dehalococcoidia bacterium]
MNRYVCIHGHFYQPPRENPWLEEIELQDSAHPYHDWNERINAECYAPNTASRILDGEGCIVGIINNYAHMSFNIGPTLLKWLEDRSTSTYERILDADRESAERFGGEGSAMAQAFNHAIVPLCNSRDKWTQVVWGIRDFQHRFGRSPRGMWLPETAVDLETLDIMARNGVAFTVLAPHQASRTRSMGDRAWVDVSGSRVDPHRPYQVRTPSGRRIAVFFYDGPTSRAVAFEGLLTRGENFANRLLGAFDDSRDEPQLVHIATDGESYGHHHRHGDMALAYAMKFIESTENVRLTNYSQFLRMFPPKHEAQIFENTSWSCAHGIERWRSNCGCNSGGRPGWNQEWRKPLRDALDWLRDTIAPSFEAAGRELLRDPWEARNDYIDVILNRDPDNIERFYATHALRPLSEEERVRVLKLMELQRHALYMYTSCGWFFDDISGIETVQVIQYAGRVLQLADDLFGDSLESRFLTQLERAKSNIPEHRDGRHIYEKWVKPAQVDLLKVGAHYAVSSLFEDYSEQTKIYFFRAEREDYRRMEAGIAKLALGRVRLVSELTGESARAAFGVLHFGDHNLSAGVRPYGDDASYQVIVEEISEVFSRADLPEALRLLDKHFLGVAYSLRSLFRDEQRRVLNVILAATLAEAEANYRTVYEHHAPLMRFLADLGSPLPRAFGAAAELVLNSNLRNELQSDNPSPESVRALLDEVALWNVQLGSEELGFVFQLTLDRLAERMNEAPLDVDVLHALGDAVEVGSMLPFQVVPWRPQNMYYDLLHSLYPEMEARAAAGDEEAHTWLEPFKSLGAKLQVRVP